MHTVQRDAKSVPTTRIVYYHDGGVAAPILPGYAVCYDIAAPLVPAGDNFKERTRGAQVVQPATANLLFFAGIVKKVHERMGSGTDYSGFLEIYEPKYGSFVQALVGENVVVGSVLVPVDGEFHLILAATTDIAEDVPIGAVGRATEIDATLTATPAKTPIMFAGA